jgi:hypothetical protein
MAPLVDDKNSNKEYHTLNNLSNQQVNYETPERFTKSYIYNSHNKQVNFAYLQGFVDQKSFNVYFVKRWSVFFVLVDRNGCCDSTNFLNAEG